MQSAFNSAITSIAMKQQTLKEASAKLRQQIEEDALNAGLKMAEDFAASTAKQILNIGQQAVDLEEPYRSRLV